MTCIQGVERPPSACQSERNSNLELGHFQALRRSERNSDAHLFGPQRAHRIRLRRPARGQVTGERRRPHRRQRHPRERHRIPSAHAV